MERLGLLWVADTSLSPCPDPKLSKPTGGLGTFHLGNSFSLGILFSVFVLFFTQFLFIRYKGFGAVKGQRGSEFCVCTVKVAHFDKLV